MHGCVKEARIAKELVKFNGFLPIHDCFGIIFKDIEELNRIIRKVLIDLFKDD